MLLLLLLRLRPRPLPVPVPFSPVVLSLPSPPPLLPLAPLLLLPEVDDAAVCSVLVKAAINTPMACGASALRGSKTSSTALAEVTLMPIGCGRKLRKAGRMEEGACQSLHVGMAWHCGWDSWGVVGRQAGCRVEGKGG